MCINFEEIESNAFSYSDVKISFKNHMTEQYKLLFFAHYCMNGCHIAEESPAPQNKCEHWTSLAHSLCLIFFYFSHSESQFCPYQSGFKNKNRFPCCSPTKNTKSIDKNAHVCHSIMKACFPLYVSAFSVFVLFYTLLSLFCLSF